MRLFNTVLGLAVLMNSPLVSYVIANYSISVQLNVDHVFKVWQILHNTEMALITGFTVNAHLFFFYYS